MPQYVPAELPDRRSLLRQWHRVIGPRGLKAIHVRTLGNTPLQVWTHFDDRINRVRPCTGEDCHFCKVGQSRRFLAYGAAQDQATGTLCVVEITEGAFRKLQQLGLLPGKLRGHLLTLRRHKEYVNAPVIPEVQPIKDASKLPPDFDVLPSLKRIWGWNDGHEGELMSKRKDKPKTGPELMALPIPAEGELPY